MRQSISFRRTISCVPFALTLLFAGGIDSGAQTLQASAGVDQHVKIGAAVHLDASQSTGDPLSALPLQFEWQLVSVPVGSKAALDDASSPTPSIRTDLSGTYLARCRVRQGDEVSTYANVRVNTATSVTGHPLQARVIKGDGTQGSDYCMVLDGQQLCATGSNQGVFVAVFSRSALDLVDQQTFNFSTGNDGSLKSYLAKWDSRVLIVLFSLGSSGEVSDWGASLARYGATDAVKGVPSGDALTFIGSPGLKQGEGWEMGPGTLTGINGYLVPDSNNNFTFTQFDYLPFNLLPEQIGKSGASIQIGTQPALEPDKPTGSAGGFLVAVVDRALLSTTGPGFAKYTFDTASGTGTQGLIDKLNALRTAEDVLVFITSYGSPNAAWGPQFANFAWAVNKYGGTYEYLANMKTSDRYSAVLASDFVLESASTRTPNMPRGILRGALGRKHQGNWYSAVASSLTQSADLDLYAIIGQAPKSWPHPANNYEQNAFTWIGHLLCGDCTDLRLSYNDTNVSLPSWQTLLSATPYPASEAGSFSEIDFNNVKAQLLLEFVYAANAQRFQTNISSLWTDQQANFGLISTAVSTKVKNALKPNPQSLVDKLLEGVISEVLQLTEMAISSALVDVVNEVVELEDPESTLQAILNFGLQTAKDNLGNAAEATPSIDDTVADLDQRTAYTFAQQLDALGTTFNFISEDWGRLQGLGQKLNNPGDPQWRWNGAKTTGSLLNSATAAMEAGVYKSLMQPSFGIFEWRSCWEDPDDPGQMNISDGLIPNHPWRNWPLEAYLATNDNHCDPPYSSNVIVLDTTSGDFNKKEMPALLDHLYAGHTDGGLGIPKPDLFRHFGLPHSACFMDSGCRPTGPLPMDTLSEPEPKPPHLVLTSMAGRRLSNSQIAVDLQITNGGSGTAGQILLQSITVSGMKGTGEAAYIGNAPLQLNLLAPGESSKVELVIQADRSLKAFKLTETFSAVDTKQHAYLVVSAQTVMALVNTVNVVPAR